MKIDAFSRLFSQNNSATSNAYSQTSAEVTEKAREGSEAVNLAASFGRSTVEQTPPDREARKAEIKKQIETGTYKPDLRKVAEALLGI